MKERFAGLREARQERNEQIWRQGGHMIDCVQAFIKNEVSRMSLTVLVHTVTLSFSHGYTLNV